MTTTESHASNETSSYSSSQAQTPQSDLVETANTFTSTRRVQELNAESYQITSTATPIISSGSKLSKAELEQRLKYTQGRLQGGIKCPPPPPLPPNYVCRQNLLDKVVSKICQSTIDPKSCGTSLTVTGAGGFGKTSIVTALCHQAVIKEQFTDGTVFVTLGPQATDPSMILNQLYHLLTGQHLKSGKSNNAEQEINQLTSLHCQSLLVIIDDVWHVEDAEPIVNAFSSCKIVLTTRMNDIGQYIPTKQVVGVGPMEKNEVISLLSCGVMDISQLSQEDMNLLDELPQDVHLWPLLLSLIRGQLSHNLRKHHSSYHEAIHMIQRRLYDKGLTGFDKNRIERSRKYAAKLCIEVSLELLTNSLSNSMKKLILWTGISTSLPTTVLQSIWNVSKYEATDIVDVLWAYGLVQLNDITIPLFNKLSCVEVHAVVSQYIIESLDSAEIISLSPHAMGSYETIVKELNQTFSVHVTKSFSAIDWLNCKLSGIENFNLPYFLQCISSHIVTDALQAKLFLSSIPSYLGTSQYIATFVPQVCQDISKLSTECCQLLNKAHSLTRKLNQKVQNCLVQRNYLNLVQAVQAYISNYPIGLVAQQAVATLEKAKPYCDGELLSFITMACEMFYIMTPDYHSIKLWVLPQIELLVKEHRQIEKSLQSGQHDREAVLQYYFSGKHNEEVQLINNNSMIKAHERLHQMQYINKPYWMAIY